MKNTENRIKTAISGLNDDAAGYYDELKEILEKDGRFKKGDEKALARLCHLYSIADVLEKEINDAWGVQLVKSNLPLYDKVVKNILSLESAFHLNPNSRKDKAKGEDKKKKGFDLTGGMKAA
jgi:phage terminase small subunit